MLVKTALRLAVDTSTRGRSGASPSNASTCLSGTCTLVRIRGQNKKTKSRETVVCYNSVNCDTGGAPLYGQHVELLPLRCHEKTVDFVLIMLILNGRHFCCYWRAFFTREHSVGKVCLVCICHICTVRVEHNCALIRFGHDIYMHIVPSIEWVHNFALHLHVDANPRHVAFSLSCLICRLFLPLSFRSFVAASLVHLPTHRSSCITASNTRPGQTECLYPRAFVNMSQRV